MTEVTGLQQKEGADPHPARRFAFENVERLSKLPMYIALLLTGIAVYFKTAMSARADVHEESEPGAAPAEEEQRRSDRLRQRRRRRGRTPWRRLRKTTNLWSRRSR